jgi:1,4-alpha-glucan branching enzyme
MHDTLDYYKSDPFFRKGAHDKLTFAMMYEYSEKFVNPLSHDEVVHMKGSLLRKMPGDEWQRLANLRTLLGYSITRPGKSLFFMGAELGPWSEWNHDASLEWHLLEDPRRQGLQRYLAAAGQLYRQYSCFWRHDHDPSGYAWIDVADKAQSVLSYVRYDGASHAVIVLNLTPVPRDQYRLGAPTAGPYRVALNGDAAEYGGSGYPVAGEVIADGEPYHGFAQSMMLTLPPLSMLVLVPDPMPDPTAVTPVIAAEVVRADIEQAEALLSARPRAPRKPRVRKSSVVAAPKESAREAIVVESSAASSVTSSVDRAKAKAKAKKLKASRVDDATTQDAAVKKKGEKKKAGKKKSAKKKRDDR